MISRKLSDSPGISGIEILRELAEELDGAWNLAFLNANGDMFVSRDPTGIRPLCYAIKDSLFAAASESCLRVLIARGIVPRTLPVSSLEGRASA